MPDRFDRWLADDGPAALLFRRNLLPCEGKEAWIFPPTFAQSESADDEEESSGGGEYQIDPLPDDKRVNVCLIDSVGSQANRMEPVFMRPPYAALVPQWSVEMKAGDFVNLLEVGHRAADAAVRFSRNLGPRLWSAFELIKRKRDCSALARLAPTSLVFGVWDSRATGVKIQRVVRSVVRAYNVKKAKRSATYQAAYGYTENEMISRAHDKGTGKTNPLSQEGFKYSLASGTHGGVLVLGDIQQEAVINLVALRTATGDLNLKRYLLGLSLVALSFRDQGCFNLREGCLLRAASTEDFDGKWKSINFDGTDNPEAITHNESLSYAQLAVQHVALDKPEPVHFDKETADAWLNIEKKERKLIAKTMHPTEAVARKQKKQAEDDAANPADSILKNLKAIKLGVRPKQGKPPKVQPEKFAELKLFLESTATSANTEASLKELVSELLDLIQKDQDSHLLHDELTKKVQAFKVSGIEGNNEEDAK